MMRDYYSEFLEEKAGSVSVYEVSKVSEATFRNENISFDTFDTFDTEQSDANQGNFFADILAAIDFDQKDKDAETLCNTESMGITERLSTMIERGTVFDVGLQRFEITGADCLNTSERDFLSINKDSILCTLQQSLLLKHLFNKSDYLFSDFAFEIAEREMIMSESVAVSSYEIYFEAVKEVTAKWFVQLLKLS